MALTPTPLSEPTLLQLLVDCVPALLVDDFLQQTVASPDAYPAELVSSLRAALEQGERDTLVARLRCVDKGLPDACSRFTGQSLLDNLRRHVKCSTLKVLIRELDLRPVPLNSKRLERLQQLFDCITVEEDPLSPPLRARPVACAEAHLLCQRPRGAALAGAAAAGCARSHGGGDGPPGEQGDGLLSSGVRATL